MLETRRPTKGFSANEKQIRSACVNDEHLARFDFRERIRLASIQNQTRISDATRMSFNFPG